MLDNQVSFETTMLLQVAKNAVAQGKIIQDEVAMDFLKKMDEENADAKVLVVDGSLEPATQYIDNAGQYAIEHELSVRDAHEFFTHLFFTQNGVSIVYHVPQGEDSILKGNYYRIS